MGDTYFFKEAIAFMLGEQLLLGPNIPYSDDGTMFNYIKSCISEEDMPNAHGIYNNIVTSYEKVSKSEQFLNLFNDQEFFYKYEYTIGSRTTTIVLTGETIGDCQV